MTDFALAVLHHLLVFAVFAVFAVEMALIRPGLDAAAAGRIARIDGAYGALALAVVVVGFARVVWGLKGWDYYSTYWVFWAKVAAFLVVGLLSIRPTLRMQRWARVARADPRYRVSAEDVAAVRPWLHGQGVFLLLIPVLAAMMARGVLY